MPTINSFGYMSICPSEAENVRANGSHIIRPSSGPLAIGHAQARLHILAHTHSLADTHTYTII